MNEAAFHIAHRSYEPDKMVLLPLYESSWLSWKKMLLDNQFQGCAMGDQK
jgi:hypothetical protein